MSFYHPNIHRCELRANGTQCGSAGRLILEILNLPDITKERGCPIRRGFRRVGIRAAGRTKF